MDPLLCSILVKSQSHNQYVWINRLYINDEFGVSVHDRLQSWMKCCANRHQRSYVKLRESGICALGRLPCNIGMQQRMKYSQTEEGNMGGSVV